MRVQFHSQLQLGGSAISDVKLDVDCRHELIPILKAVQYMNGKPGVRDRLLQLIERDLLGQKSSRRGAPGMSCWEALVLAAVRLGCDLDYDALHDLSNNHRAVRSVMGLGVFDNKRFPRSTLNDNLSRLKAETLQAISQLIIGEGHQAARTSPKQVRTDGFVVETNIHYPTEANLMLDGLRKLLGLAATLSQETGISGWRQHNHLLKKGKRLLREIQKTARSRKDKTERMERLHAELIEQVRAVATRCQKLVEEVMTEAEPIHLVTGDVRDSLARELKHYLPLTLQVCDLAERRVIKGEKVPNAEKLFSLFETHTQLIHRGKEPNPIEFGRHTVVVEDQLGFILDHRILQVGELEQDVTVPMIAALQERYGGSLQVASFDKGFYTPDNVKRLSATVAVACLPKKGKVTGEALERESAPAFRKARRRHPGIESAIHALEAGNGLDRCRDKGETGFHRYVALAVLGRNLQTLGRLLLEQERRQKRRQTQALAA
jgi:hypothetical protein